MPWPPFAILFPAFMLIFGGLRYSFAVRRRRTSSPGSAAGRRCPGPAR